MFDWLILLNFWPPEWILWCTLQAKKDNDSVYFQHIPAADTLPAIEPRRLVTSTPYALPAPAALVTEALLDAFVEVPAEKVRVHRAVKPCSS